MDEIIKAFNQESYRAFLGTSKSVSHLDLGGALAAFGLILTVYQLRKPQWDIILRIRGWWQRNIFWMFSIAGLLLVLFRIIVPETIIFSYTFPFSNPLFYEISACIFFVFSPLSLILFSTRTKNLFNNKTARRFYVVLVTEISKTDNERTGSVLEILLDNIENICKAARGRGYSKEVNESARAILDVVLSERSVVKILTTQRLDALISIIDSYKQFDISRYQTDIGFSRILSNLFFDKDSFCYKQLDASGLSLSMNLYSSIFESPQILSNFDLFSSSVLGYSDRKTINENGIEVLIKALSTSIGVYLKNDGIPARHINNGLSYLSDIFGDLCQQFSADTKRGNDDIREVSWKMHLISSFLGHDYPFICYRDELCSTVVDKEKVVPEVSFYSDDTINAGVAGALYKSFEQLSYVENTNDVYHTVLTLLHGMMYNYEYKIGYRVAFEKRMWEQIYANVIKRHYPAALRPYLEVVGFCLASDESQRHGWIGEQAERMRRLLYVDLKPLLDSSMQMVNKAYMKEELLPSSMQYEDGNFYYTYGFGKGDKKIIEPPPTDSLSALGGVEKDTKALI